MTTDDLLAMPQEGVERELIRGLLREKPVTPRDFPHSWVQAEIAGILSNWRKQQPKPRGRVLCGEAGFRIRRDPDTAVGIDVAYISPELAAATPKKARVVDGLPVLAVEVLSPNDKQEEITEKVEEYLDAGIPLVWVVDPVHSTVTVYRPDALPQLFNLDQEITAEPHLPGFRVAVAEVFED